MDFKVNIETKTITFVTYSVGLDQIKTICERIFPGDADVKICFETPQIIPYHERPVPYWDLAPTTVSVESTNELNLN